MENKYLTKEETINGIPTIKVSKKINDEGNFSKLKSDLIRYIEGDKNTCCLDLSEFNLKNFNSNHISLMDTFQRYCNTHDKKDYSFLINKELEEKINEWSLNYLGKINYIKKPSNFQKTIEKLF
ncbi:hypothetical protein GW932_00050 [archaeon]|nr:hypothetical protein [archaeon]